MAKLPYAKFTVFLAFVFGCDVASSQSLFPFAGQITVAPNENITCSSQMMCLEDKCDVGRWCVQLGDKWVQHALVTCDQTTDERYCNAGICSKKPLPRCDSSEFTCPTIDGVYPDPSSCTRYHICVNGVRRTNDCPINNVYDHQIGGCKYRRFVSDCVVFRCSNRDGQPIVYPGDDRIYGRCFSGKAYISGRCRDHERYNLVTEKCERYCRSTGTQPPDLNRCGKFVLCAEVAPRRYQPVEMTCGCDQAYDENEKRCVSNAPCVKDTPEIWCSEEGPNGGSDNDNADGDGDGDGNEDSGGNGASTTERPVAFTNNVANSNCNDDGNQQSRNVQRRSLLNKRSSKKNNNDSDTDNVPTTVVNENAGDDNNNDNIDGNLINEDNNNDNNGNNNNNNNNGNNDNNQNPGLKQRENFIRFIFDWIIRIVVGQPV